MVVDVWSGNRAAVIMLQDTETDEWVVAWDLGGAQSRAEWINKGGARQVFDNVVKAATAA